MPSRSLLTKKEEKLFHYIKRGKYDKFTSLLSEKCNFDILSIVKKYVNEIYHRNGNTLLHYCCKYNSAPILLYLLKRIKHVDVENNNGETALQIATKHKNVELCKILLSKGSDYLMINRSGKNALDYGLDKLIENKSEEDGSCNIFIYDSDEEDMEEEEDNDWYFEENYEEYNQTSNKEEFKRRVLKDWEEEMKRIEEENKEKKEKKKREKEKYKKEEENKEERMNIYKRIEKNNEMRWLKFINSNPKYLRIENIPFPVSLVNEKIQNNNILGLNNEMNKNEIKRIIYKNQSRWHPDKFERRFNELLREEDREEIMRRVKETSQLINKLKSEYLK